jgi:hypothetical protein
MTITELFISVRCEVVDHFEYSFAHEETAYDDAILSAQRLLLARLSRSHKEQPDLT